MDAELLDQSLSFHGSALMQQLADEHGESLSVPAALRRRYAAPDSPAKDRWTPEDTKWVQISGWFSHCVLSAFTKNFIELKKKKVLENVLALISVLWYNVWQLTFEWKPLQH